MSFNRAALVAAAIAVASLCAGTGWTGTVRVASAASTAGPATRSDDQTRLSAAHRAIPLLAPGLVTTTWRTAIAPCATRAAWIVPVGGAPDLGDPGLPCLNAPVVGVASAPHGRGYWLACADGGVFPVGSAVGFGSLGGVRLNRPVVGMTATPDGGGYWLVAADGGVFPFGNARGLGSLGGMRLNRPVVGMAATPDGGGYWLVASDGGVFPFGNAQGWGSLGAVRLNAPVVSLAPTPDGQGYWLAAADGGVFPFGAAPGAGSGAGRTSAGVVGVAAAAQGGYWLAERDGAILAFGGAPDQPRAPTPLPVVAIGAASDGGAFLAEGAQGTGSTRSVPPTNGMPFALTFDDCGTRPQIEAILDALNVHSWHAAFFPTGQCRDSNPWLVPELLARGHIVCNHTYAHPYLTRLNDATIAAEIGGGVHAGCDLFRPPYGDWDGPNGRVARIAAAAGYRMQMWDTDPRDWAGTPAWMIVAQIRGHGGVVVLHMQAPHTAEAVRQL